jgi:hypothetical protein
VNIATNSKAVPLMIAVSALTVYRMRVSLNVQAQAVTSSRESVVNVLNASTFGRDVVVKGSRAIYAVIQTQATSIPVTVTHQTILAQDCSAMDAVSPMRNASSVVDATLYVRNVKFILGKGGRMSADRTVARVKSANRTSVATAMPVRPARLAPVSLSLAHLEQYVTMGRACVVEPQPCPARPLQLCRSQLCLPVVTSAAIQGSAARMAPASPHAAHAKPAIMGHAEVVIPPSVKPASMAHVQPKVKHRVTRLRAALQRPQYAVPTTLVVVIVMLLGMSAAETGVARVR